MWTKDMIAFLRENYDKFPSMQIAKELGKTKGSVIGKANRLGLSTPKSNVIKLSAEKKKKIAQGKKVKIPKYIPITESPKYGSLKLSQLSSNQCRYPHGDPRDKGFGFCGKATQRSVYCEEHAKRCYKNQESI